MTHKTILDALGHDKVAERLGIAKTRVRRAYDEERLPAVWYATLCDMTRKRLPFCLFTFKGQGHE